MKSYRRYSAGAGDAVLNGCVKKAMSSTLIQLNITKPKKQKTRNKIKLKSIDKTKQQNETNKQIRNSSGART